MIDALDGEAGCRRLSAAFYARVADDPELRPLFPGKSLRCATEEFSAFLVQLLGGDDQMTQHRWWLSLRESHARFQIMESQRAAWLKQMEAALRSSQLKKETQDALLQFFVSSSNYVLGRNSEPVKEPELAERWDLAKTLDILVANILAGRDGEVLQRFGEFAARPSLFVGVLSRMLQTRGPALIKAVIEAIDQNPALGFHHHAGRTLLHYAAGAGCPKIVALLLRIGADPNVLDAGNHTPLYRLANECAADTGPEIVRMLVDAGAEVNHCGGVTRATPLHMAARRGHLGVAQALLDLGAALDARDTKGCTPLHRAINCRKPEVVKLLRQRMGCAYVQPFARTLERSSIQKPYLRGERACQIIVRLCPGQSEEGKVRLSEQIVDDGIATLGQGEDSISAIIEEIKASDGRRRCIGPRSQPTEGCLCKKLASRMRIGTKDNGMEITRNGTRPSGKGPEDWFTGEVRIDPLFAAPDPARVAGACVTFEPGARTAWHTHPLGQTLIVVSGMGWVQRQGADREDIRPGDVVWFPPGEKHWHGATATTALTHIAIQEQLNGKMVDWMEKVSEEQYQS